MVHATGSRSRRWARTSWKRARKEAIDKAIEEPRGGDEGSDKERDQRPRPGTLAEASGKMAEHYVRTQQPGTAQDAGHGRRRCLRCRVGKADDDVVDAEFEEVNHGK